jgi:hypothetical protein
MKNYYLYFALAFIFLISENVGGQDAAKPVDPTPFERPAYLTYISIRKENPEVLLRTIADSIKKYGYADVRIDFKDQKIEAKKNDVNDPRNYCKVLLWFERDFQEPDKSVKVFLLCGRFEYMIAKTTGIYRVKLSESAEDQYFGKLRNSIISLQLNN